jgi:hypothetical protein
VATIDAADLAEAAELMSEEEFASALDRERRWGLEVDGRLVDASDDPARGVLGAGHALHVSYASRPRHWLSMRW